MQDLYDILGVTPSASNKEINAALRQLVRRYNEETARGTRDSTEALKFINHARITFADPGRRMQYDADLAAERARLAAEQEAAQRQLAEQQASAAAIADNVIRFDEHLSSTRVTVSGHGARAAGGGRAKPLPPLEHHYAPLTMDGTVNPMTVDPVLTPVAMGEEFERLQFPNDSAANGQSDLRSVLTTRDNAVQRSTAPRPLARFAARMIDYALWGTLLAVALHYFDGTGELPAETTAMLRGPFVAPVLITLSWALVEAILLIFFPVTPGKFLLNIRVALNVSNPYAGADPGAHMAAAFARALRAWWRGMAAGVAPLAVVTLYKARGKLRSFKETTWDFDSDCLTTHGKLNPLAGLFAAILLCGSAWVYGNYWLPPFWQTVTVGWQSSQAGFLAGREMWKVLSGDLPTYSKELPAAPAKENRTVALEQEAQALADARAWQDLSEHCLAWRREDKRNAAAWYCYGRARHQLADHGSAMTALKRAAVLAPQNDDIRRLLRDASLADMQQKQLRKRQASQQAVPVQ